MTNRQRTRGHRNIEAMHATSKRELTDANAAKYGKMPWGQFYHYVAMNLAPFVTKPKFDAAIAEALRQTEHQEEGIRREAQRNL